MIIAFSNAIIQGVHTQWTHLHTQRTHLHTQYFVYKLLRVDLLYLTADHKTDFRNSVNMAGFTHRYNRHRLLTRSTDVSKIKNSRWWLNRAKGQGFYYIPGVLCQCPQADPRLSAAQKETLVEFHRYSIVGYHTYNYYVIVIILFQITF